ncbi:MAG: glycogen/starch/alpha-glucan phosphorylase, partial [Oscillospiraceae bacterium]|nr:glycogen/starch/alpha-glucan phosphorylase [Oscillospiraceae bacterium]
MAKEQFGKSLSQCTNQEAYQLLLKLVKNQEQDKVQKPSRKLYYISAEFLIGKLLSNHLINLGIYDEVKAALEAAGKSLAEIEETEPEPSLGNGGLGRLAACFLDSIATLNLPGDGVGLCYHYGLFRQVFQNHKQEAIPDPWMEPESWLEKTDVRFQVPFGGFTLESAMYDIAVPGYGGKTVNKLHLFDVKLPDEDLVQNGIDFDKNDIRHNLTLFLYPDDSDDAGRLLRVYQQYFMVSSAAQLILQEAKENG